jgi:hypothetical protein
VKFGFWKLEKDVQDSYLREFLIANSPHPRRLMRLWKLHVIQQTDDVSKPVGEYYGGQVIPAPSVPSFDFITRQLQESSAGLFGCQLDLKKMADVNDA